MHILIAMDTGDPRFVKGRGQTDAALYPPLEDRPLDGVGIHHPAAQIAEVAVLQALPGLVGRLVLPLVELELDRHVVVKDFAALLGRNYAIEFVEEKSVRLTNP